MRGNEGAWRVEWAREGECMVMTHGNEWPIFGSRSDPPSHGAQYLPWADCLTMCAPFCHSTLSLSFLSQVAGRTNDSAGDGTTTASVLAREMIHYGLQFVTAGANPIEVKRGIDKTCDFLVAKLKEHAKPVKGRVDIKVRLPLHE